MNAKLFSDLNPDQINAIQSRSSVLIINAGPGTGKTKTLISRIAYLIHEKHVNSSSILAITFTKKAAAEMKERLSRILTNTSGMPWIGTFHSFAFDILSREKEIKIVDEKKRSEIIAEILKKAEFKLISKNDANRTISLYKSQVINRTDSISVLDTLYKKFVSAYIERLKSEGFMDYDDILLEFFALLQNSEKLQTLQNQFRHILVDEFQDTNEVQYSIIKILAMTGHTLFIIGDPLQSIYSFRGAGVNMFVRVMSDFPTAEQIPLSTNYRSAKNIIHVSSLLFPDSPHLIPDRKSEGSVDLIHTLHEFAEADWIVRTISARVGGTDLLQSAKTIDHTQTVCFSDVAVIYRNHRVSTAISEKLFESGIPYQVIGEGAPYEQKEIQCIINILRFIYNRTDQTRMNVENNPFMKGQTDIQLLFKDYNTYSKLSDLIQKIVQHFRLLEQLENKNEALQNVMQFQSSMSRFDTAENPLEKAIQYLDFLKEHEYYDPHCDKVTLLTMHASKGLEFSDVFICGFEDGLIPNNRRNSDKEEEKRLLYVAMTRAKDNLYLLSARSRNKKETAVSQFKKSIECVELMEKEDNATERIKKRMEKIKIKKSQMKIF